MHSRDGGKNGVLEAIQNPTLWPQLPERH